MSDWYERLYTLMIGYNPEDAWSTDETGCFHIHIELRIKQTKIVIVFINGIFIKTAIIILLTREKSYNVSVHMSVSL